MADSSSFPLPDPDDDDDDQQDDFQQNDPDDENPIYQLKKDEKLPEDHDTPFSPPTGVQDRISQTHPSTDTNIDPEEDYDEGIEGAADIDLPDQAADESNDIPDTEDD